jgi:hypothetical protein
MSYANLLQLEEEFSPQLPDTRTLYVDYHNRIMDLAKNLVCASCGCIDHDTAHFTTIPVLNASLLKLQVDPSLVPFDFTTGDNLHIMIDPLGIVENPSGEGRLLRSVLISRSCYSKLQEGVRPTDALANFCWIGAVPPQL